MERAKLNENENILVKVDQNNLIYIDPNSVIDKDGYVSSRGVKQENLVIYVNLEADLIPRSILVADNDKNTLTSIAKGSFNFLRSHGNPSNPDFNTNWTNAFIDFKEKEFVNKETGEVTKGAQQYDETGQSFGMTSVEIDTKGFNAIPEVTINFTDVRGKTLFESPENSPYKSFFHVPWPIFYLTVKGFYGKAIRYRLHLVKFSSKFDDSSGNFEITTKFIGSTFAYLSDIPLKGVMNAPYMFLVETTKDEKTDGDTTIRKVSRSSKGYATLRSVYAEYKDKGLIPPDFPVKTLRELIVAAQSLDKLWEKQILGEKLDGRIFVGLEDYEKTLKNIESRILGWRDVRLTQNYRLENPGQNEIKYFELAGDKTSPVYVLGNTATIKNTLEAIISDANKELSDSKLFTDNILSDKSMNIDFTRDNLLSKSLGHIKRYVTRNNSKQYEIAMELLLKDFNDIKTLYESQRDKLEEAVEKKMNDVLRDKSKSGFGFEPTIRNIFAVLLANADTYIRLLKDVHLKSFQVAKERRKYIDGLSDENIKGDKLVYPWPEVKKNDVSKQRIIAYPGDRALAEKLKAYDPRIWPEVDFVEDYIGISTNRVDTNTDKETGVGNINYIFENDDIDRNKMLRISSLFTTSNAIPYINPAPSSFLYEIWERAYQITLVDSFDDITLRNLADQEFNNIKEATKDDDELIYLLSKSAVTASNLVSLLERYSPYERYPYYQDSIPTVTYIKNLLGTSHKIEKYEKSTSPVTPTGFEEVNISLLLYGPELYRTKIYPFYSTTYKNYLGFTDSQYDINYGDLTFQDSLKIDTSEGFVTSPIDPEAWVKQDYRNNILINKLKVLYTDVNILNTPYFHKQLYEDFFTVGSVGKYVGSAYLLLNSLPFHDLQDYIQFTGTTLSANVRMSSLFREIGSTHYVPYHLILKWGSLYHRYKKYIKDNVDILSGFLDSSNVTQPITGSTFFSNDGVLPIYTAFTASGETITYTSQEDIGIHPYYDAIFHQIVNGYMHYDVDEGNTSYSGNVTNGIIQVRSRLTSNRLKYWTQFVDNSKFQSSDLRYTLLPCDGANGPINRTLTLDVTDTFDTAYQSYFRTVWVDDDYMYNEFSGRTFPSYSQYHMSYVTGDTENTDNIYSISENYRKVIDLIGTFSPSILEEFEEMFIDFATEKINDDSIYNPYKDIKYNKFQDLLYKIVSVKKEQTDSSDINILINQIRNKQLINLEDTTNEILSVNNLIKFTIGNPKEIDSYVFNGFARMQSGTTFSYGEYDVSQLTSTNTDLIKLYIGEDIDGYYQGFFSSLNIELSEENILLFRPLILIYAGYVRDGNTNNRTSFVEYIRENIFLREKTDKQVAGSSTRLSNFLFYLTRQFSSLKPRVVRGNQSNFTGYNDDPLKLELYNHFKSFNDKWIAGNSIGQKLLLEEFLFLDKANVDIGNKLYFNVDRLLSLDDKQNQKINLWTAISVLIQETGLDMRALPAYVNFYGTNYSNKAKITPSSKVAQNLFGTFLDVDYQDASPKVVVQLVGPTSKHLADKGDENRYKDDSYFVGDTNNNPLIITNPEVFRNADLYKSNRVVAFEVNFGDQNQSLFKGVTLDQTSLKNTTESFVVLENLARSESGAGAYNVDIGLFDYYRQASYTCDVEMMGNMMIQPTMYFYLKNIPMFRGSYWITEVKHSIKNNNISTRFKGTRIPYASLPDPKDYFLSSYRVLFEKLMNKALSRYKNTDAQTTQTTVTIKDQNGATYETDIGLQIENENVNDILIKKVGISSFGIPYNGFLGEKYIQLINFNGEEWFRTKVLKLGGTNYPLTDESAFGLVSNLSGVEKLLWSEIKDTAKTNEFYTTKFKIIKKEGITPEHIITATTKFVVPKNKKQGTPYTIKSLSYSQNGAAPIRIFTGQIGTGPNIEGYGMGMSESLMKNLNIQDGDIVYFKLE